jgi:F-type H+-transporting ATPase subunit b
MDEYLELISLNIWHIVATIGNLLILTWILKKFLWKPVTNMLEKRKNEVDEIYQKAEDAKRVAEKDRLEYRAKLDGAEEEAEEIVRAATVRAEGLSESIIDDAKSRADDTLRRAEAEIELEKKRAMNELKDEISSISMQIAENVVGREMNEDDHRELIDSFIDEL